MFVRVTALDIPRKVNHIPCIVWSKTVAANPKQRTRVSHEIGATVSMSYLGVINLMHITSLRTCDCLDRSCGWYFRRNFLGQHTHSIRRNALKQARTDQFFLVDITSIMIKLNLKN